MIVLISCYAPYLNLSTTYKVQDQHFDTVKLENKSIEDLINRMYEDLLINLTQNI